MPTESSPPESNRPSVEMTRGSFEAERTVGTGDTVPDRRPVLEQSTPRAEEVDLEVSRREQEIDFIAKPAADVLADMEAFQKEIDALREKYGRA
jgi:hypothetical protein